MTIVAAIARGIAKAGDAVSGAKNEFLAKRQSTKLKESESLKTAEEKQRSYDTARQSLLGEFSSSPISGCHDCLVYEKAQRRAARLDLVNRAMVSCPDHPAEAVELRELMDEVENMRCAKHVYTANDINSPGELRDNPPPGFLKPTESQLAEMGLEPEMLSPRNSNFRAAVYMKDPGVWGESPHPAAVITFRGSTPEKEDWDNNFAQNDNKEAHYYRRAVEIGDALRTSGSDAQIVGHSLGGGLASAAQGASGLNASTYNSAGLHPETVPRYLKELGEAARNAEKEKIKAFRIKGEVLTKTQEDSFISTLGFARQAVGKKTELNPAHDQPYWEKNLKSKTDRGDTYDGYLHGMDEVIASTEKQKEADEEALKSCLKHKGGNVKPPVLA